MLALAMSGAFAQQAPNLQGQKITVVTFGGALQQGIKDGWVTPFERATGAQVIMDSPNPRAKLKAQVEAGNPTWDIYTEDAAYISEYCGVLFEKIDTSKFIAAGMDKRFVNNECGMPGAIVGYYFAYNEEKYRNDPPRSWADFFDLKKYPGKRAMHNTPMNGSLEMALLADGVPADKLYPLDVDRALRKLDSIKSNIAWTQSAGGLTDALVNNQADIVLGYSGRVFAAAKAGAKVDIVRDQQIVTWDHYAVVKGSKNKPAAEAFLEFAAQPEQQAKMTELRASGNANLKSRPQVDALVSRFLPAPDKSIVQNQAWWSKNFESVSQRYVAWQSK
jgi:putative spermidine/putrescine transport system substrate-binding protein